MKRYSTIAAVAAVIVLGFGATPASAQLGGLLGGDSGGGLGGVVGGVTETVGGVVGGLTGGSSGSSSGGTGGLDLDGSDGDIGVGGVLTVGVTSDSSGTNANGTLLGGGGGTLSVPLGGLLGGNSGVNLNLPGLGNGILTGPQGPRGLNGTNGINGIAGLTGSNGSNGTDGLDGIKGSSKLKMLMRILENRAWLRFAQGNKVCLPTFGVASVSGWLPQKDFGALQQLLAAYGADIQTLQGMLKKCRGGNQAVNSKQVIGVDLRDDGSVIVFTL